MKKFYQFSEKHFEYKLRELLITNKLGFLKDVTQQWIEEGNISYEKIYSISTKNKAVEIILFSSIAIQQNRVRDIGQDAVRLVYRWKTKNGYLYKRIAKHYRIETLFNNLKKTIEESQQFVFNLNSKEFTKHVEEYINIAN